MRKSGAEQNGGFKIKKMFLTMKYVLQCLLDDVSGPGLLPSSIGSEAFKNITCPSIKTSGGSDASIVKEWYIEDKRCAVMRLKKPADGFPQLHIRYLIR